MRSIGPHSTHRCCTPKFLDGWSGRIQTQLCCRLGRTAVARRSGSRRSTCEHRFRRGAGDEQHADQHAGNTAHHEGDDGAADVRFEGNAQSFRIVTNLAIRTSRYAGLNLTAATLNALLKYPHFRAELGEYERKWGVYDVPESARARAARSRRNCRAHWRRRGADRASPWGHPC